MMPIVVPEMPPPPVAPPQRLPSIHRSTGTDSLGGGCRSREFVREIAGRRDLSLMRGLHLNLKRAAAERIERRCRGLSRRVGRDGHSLQTAGKRRWLAAANRERHRRARNRQVVAIAHFDERFHRGLLLDDIDGVFALEDDNAKR